MSGWYLVGHRGVGKSGLLKKLKERMSGSEWKFLSLDEEIEKSCGRLISDIFRTDGEAFFRELEQNVLAEISSAETIIDVGAGYEGSFPEGSKVLWVTRKIDSSQSRFLNRPILDGSLRLGEKRFNERQKRYSQWADLKIELREGENFFGTGEVLLFNALFLPDKKSNVLSKWMWTLTGNSSDFEIRLLKKLGMKEFEFRTDFSTEPPESINVMTSLRDPQKKETPEETFFDWPLEWGVKEGAPVLSLHSLKGSIEKTLSTLPDPGDSVLKLALPVDSFSDLIKGHRWLMENPGRRAFLPMSKEGRWDWYRLLSSPFQALNFLQFSTASAVDQPRLLDVLNFKPEFSRFAAILGSPVRHSQTPTFHQNYFNRKNCNTLAIDLSEEEFEVALPFLQGLGLVAAAVTSPLKKVAARWIGFSEESVNTLYFNGKTWNGTSTDVFGFEELIPYEFRQSLAVWGGGGVLSDLHKLIPQASVWSSRTGELKSGPSIENPRALVWAVGPSSFEKEGKMPPAEWPIEAVFDLNYTQNSHAIDFAFKTGCQYHSGLVMFAAQARKQQEFWNERGL